MAEQSTTPTIQEVRKACERRREQFFNYVQLDIRDVLALCDEVDRLKAENEYLRGTDAVIDAFRNAQGQY